MLRPGTRRYVFVIEDEVLLKLRAIKVREGITESEQIREGIRMWLKRKGVKVRK